MADSPFAPVSPKRRALTTPEGVDLAIEIASFGARIGAFMIDMICIYVLVMLVTVIVLLALYPTYGYAALVGFIMVALFQPSLITGVLFLSRTLWFILFEMGARGATPGKRIIGLRVVARDGGRLEASSVVARNLMRDVEVFLPLVFLVSLGSVYAMLGLGWTLIFLLLPLLNRDRMRAGDVIAGTWVIALPRIRIRDDLSVRASNRDLEFAFTPAQIAVYGAFELQTLEALLRGHDNKALATVAEVIRAKIGWPNGDDDRAFLNAYYAAVRAQLEKGLLFGKARRSKYDAPIA